MARDTTGALDELHLAALYLQRARERSSPADLALAEGAARRSLAHRRAHNGEAWHALALALIGQHRFTEARAAADSLLTFDPTAPGPRSMLGEILLELGAYDAADSVFKPLDHFGTGPAVAARTSRWAALHGNTSHAYALLRDAQRTAGQRVSTPAEQVAWYDLRLGELAMTSGDYGVGATHFGAALAVAPDDPRVFLALSRLELARHHNAQALAYANSAMNTGEDPLALALASDAHRALGDSVQAARMFTAFETAIQAAPPSAWHRQWRLELLDHGKQLDAVLEQSRAELAVRRDVYGWDLYAWALHRNGRDAEARVAMRAALRLHTDDVMLAAHAAALGMQP